MVDRVELVPLHQRQQMLYLERRHAVRREQQFDTIDEIIDVGHVCRARCWR